VSAIVGWPVRRQINTNNDSKRRGTNMSITVTSTSAKGDAKKINAILDRYELMHFDIEVDDEGNLRFRAEEEKPDEQEELKQPEEEEPGEEGEPPLLSGSPLAFATGQFPDPGDYPGDDISGHFRWSEAVEETGTRGFHALLQELALVLQTPLLILVCRRDEDQPYVDAEAFSIRPGSKDVLTTSVEW
jgi:hypothetical protein